MMQSSDLNKFEILILNGPNPAGLIDFLRMHMKIFIICTLSANLLYLT